MAHDGFASEGPKEACGVVGIYAPGTDVARNAFFALYAMQHRGQESAGICTSDGCSTFIHRGMGLVTQVFNEQNLGPLKGHLGVGHIRYSTAGASALRNAQPYLIETMHGPLALGHNGNLPAVKPLRRKLLERGVGLSSSTDSEVIAQMIAAPPPGGDAGTADWEGRIAAFMAEAEGAYSLVLMTQHAVFGVRDPLGLRPLCVGKLGGGGGTLGYVVASESCALATIGAQYIRDVRPGEIVRLDGGGLHSTQGRPPSKRQAMCVFEYVYFARPDSICEGQTVHAVREGLGAQVARESPVEADVVVGVPDSATSSAIGFAAESGIPYGEGLLKNRYIGRTFIQPDDRLRRMGVQLKYNPLVDNLQGKRVVLVDDSIVRGNTAGPLVRLVRQGGAREVHLRIASPPVRYPCFMGVDMPTHAELIAHRRSVDEIRRHTGAESLAYVSHEGMMQVVTENIDTSEGAGHCSACFSGEYPLDVQACIEDEANAEQMVFEGITGEWRSIQ